MEKILGKKNDLLNWWMDTSSETYSTFFRFGLIVSIISIAYYLLVSAALSNIYAANPRITKAETVYLPTKHQIVADFKNIIRSDNGLSIALPVIEMYLDKYKEKEAENALHYIIVSGNPDYPFEYYGKNESSTHILHAYALPLSYFPGKWGYHQAATWMIKDGNLIINRDFHLYGKYIIFLVITGALLFISTFYLTYLWNKRIDKMRVALMSAKK